MFDTLEEGLDSILQHCKKHENHSPRRSGKVLPVEGHSLEWDPWALTEDELHSKIPWMSVHVSGSKSHSPACWSSPAVSHVIIVTCTSSRTTN
jgi:hypothetical protein